MRIRVAVILAFAISFLGLAASSASAACPVGMTCSTVTVPLDWSGKKPGTIELPLQVSEGDGPVLLNLAGGPGQSTTPFTSYIHHSFESLAPDWRVAVINQRGTGGNAIRCRGLQKLPLTDLTVRPRSAVRACGRRLGSRRGFYSTTSTVRDLEAVRKAIGVERMAIMGTSYGTYVATRYARAYPNRVSRLILDSVVPQEDVDPFLRVHMRRAGKVLRWVCGKGRCEFKSDPARDLARLVRMPARGGKVPGTNMRVKVNGPALIDWMTTVFSFEPKRIPAFGRAIHKASRGNYESLFSIAGVAEKLAAPSPAGELSWGLHAATLCTDVEFPFSIGTGTRGSREHIASRYLSAVRARSFWPFNRATAIGNGIPQTCFEWQKTKVTPPPKPGKIKRPVLIITGQYDLSTPVEYARRELRRAPKGRLVVVPKLGHGIAFSAECSLLAMAEFLAGKLKGDPCAGEARAQSSAMSWTMPAAARWPSAIAAATDGAP